MTTVDAADGFGLFVRREFFDARTCREIVARMRAGGGEEATVYGVGATARVEERVRRVARHAPPRETVESVRGRLLECMSEVGRHFGRTLSECEEPQFLRYRVGDFFVAHQDGNTGMMRLEQESRLVSVVIFLNRQSDAPDPRDPREAGDFRGGTLVFHDRRARRADEATLHFKAEPGTLVAFRAETTHEVTPVTHGERHTIACWYR
ncbi:MAG TPA: 2OG-Fe(II) oxygenase [Pyrinomonadaceae bacterium]|nr:2OG-Fe(II) oxygenase [Pyrinomonadaceae bacterium]